MRISIGRILFAAGILLTLIVVSSTQSGVGGGGQSNVGGGGQGSGGGLPAGLTYVAPTLTVSTAGTGNGQLALSGNTSGTATLTAPAVAGTSTNPIIISNAIQIPIGSASNPSIVSATTSNSGFFMGNGGNAPAVTSAGTTVATFFGNAVQILALATQTNCSVNTASPAACGSAVSGAFVVPTTTTTYTVNTSAVTAASRIFLMPMSFASNLPSSPTCVAPAITSSWTISAVSAGTSFTFALPSTTGQTCWSYWIVN